MMRSNEDAIQHLVLMAQQLPEERRLALNQWFAIQRASARSLGIEEAEWWSLIEWAMDNPLDFSFFPELAGEALAAAGAPGEPGEPVGAEQEAKARRLVGGAAASAPAQGAPTMADKSQATRDLDREVFQRFLNQRSIK